MAIDPRFIGTWNVDKSKTIGFEDFARVMGFTPDRIEVYKNLNYSVTIGQDGDLYKIEVDYKGTIPNSYYSLRVGDTIEYKSVDGQKANLTVNVENGRTLETYVYTGKNMSWVVTRSVEGDVMTSVTKVGDVTLTQYLNRA